MSPPPLPTTSPSRSAWSEAEISAYLDRPLMSARDVFPGTAGMTLRQIEDDIIKGGRFLTFHWCLSLIILSYTRATTVRYVRSWHSPAGSAWFYSVLTMFIGWWSIPGIVFAPLCFWRNARGGTDMTREVMTQAVGSVRTESILQKALTRPVGASQKLLVFFVIAVPLSVLALLFNAALNAEMTN